MPKLRNLIVVGTAACGLWPTAARAIIVGDPAGSPPDSPAAHVDPNVPTSPYAGVVGVDVAGLGPASGVLLRTTDPAHSYVLTAAHAVTNGGTVAAGAVTISVNYTGSRSTQLGVSTIHVNPGYATNPASGHDDLAVLQLSGVVPAGVPTYDLYRPAPTVGDLGRSLTLVGYGESGNGVVGVTVPADTSVKRVGRNAADAYEVDDEGSGAAEVYRFDFDRPNGPAGPLGGPTLGNAVEVNFGVGDSGGPAFVAGPGGSLLLYGVNTFGVNGADFTGGSPADTFPLFGSGGGGQLASAYAPFIDPYTGVPEPGAAALLGLMATAGLTSRRPRRLAVAATGLQS